MAFKDGFLWGGAISACQAEGARDVDGKSLTFPEIVKAVDPLKRKETIRVKITEETINKGVIGPLKDYPKRWGINFYNTYKDDIKLLAEMGSTVFRFSVSLARIFPDLESEFANEKALKFYDNVIDECLKYGIEPLITIVHFDPPIEIWTKFGS